MFSNPLHVSRPLAAISVQVQKVIQGLEEGDDSQATTSNHQMKIEPTLSISPKLEAVEMDYVSVRRGESTSRRAYFLTNA